jgi:hypothetical protein
MTSKIVRDFYRSFPNGNMYDDFFADDFKKNAANLDDSR